MSIFGVSRLTAASVRSALLLGVGFAVLALVVYGSSLHNGLVMWDDTYLIIRNPLLKTISLQTIHDIFTTYDPELYIPLTFLSYQIDVLVAGTSATMIHFTALVLHTLNALLLVWVLTRLTGQKVMAVFCGLLFLVHPLNVEVVSWASARKDVLSMFFLLLSFGCYLQQSDTLRPPRWFIASVIFFLLALLSKVSVIALAPILLLTEWRNGWQGTDSLKRLSPYFALSVIFGLIAVWGKRHIVSHLSFASTTLLATHSVPFYLQKIFEPLHLSPLYAYEGTVSILMPTFALSVLFCAIIIAYALWTLRSTKEIAYGIGIVLCALLVNATNFEKGMVIYLGSDRYVYIAWIGIFLLCIHLIVTARKHFSLPGEAAIGTLAAVGCIGIFSVLSYHQSLIWRDTESLFHAVIDEDPRSVVAYDNLAVFYANQGQTDRARTLLTQSLSIRPFAGTHVSLGRLNEKAGDTEGAIREYKEAILLDPNDPESHFTLGNAYALQNKIPEAIAELDAAIAINPGYTPALSNRAAIALQQGQIAKAKTMYQQVITIDPYFADAHYNLGLIDEQQKDLPGAIAEVDHAAKLEGDQRMATLQKLLELCASANDRAKTMDTAQRILALDPQNAVAAQLLEKLAR